MYPLYDIDTTAYKETEIVKPYWGKTSSGGNDGHHMGMKVYLSTRKHFSMDFLIDEFHEKEQRLGTNGGDNSLNLPSKGDKLNDSILLWEESSVKAPILVKSFILTGDATTKEPSESFQYASQWLDDADEKDESMSDGGITSLISSASNGNGIESTSVLLSAYLGIKGAISNLITSPTADDIGTADIKPAREVFQIPSSSSIWKSIMNNSTVHVHVILVRNGIQSEDTFQKTLNHLRKSDEEHSLLMGNVNLVKHDLPYHNTRAKRYLYRDLVYLIRRYILQSARDEVEPWNMKYTKPEDFAVYQSSLEMKQKGIGYPYWKPEVAVKLVSDDVQYPVDYVGYSGMDIVQINRHTEPSFQSGYAYMPGLYVDELGLTSEKYVPMNKTIDALPLRISFETGVKDLKGERKEEEAINRDTGLSPARWRLLSHLSKTLETQEGLFEQSDIDDVRRLIADTNVALLGITVFASTFHLLFEFLTFKTEVEFWNGNSDLTGLSVRALFLDFLSQVIIVFYLIELDSSLLVSGPAVIGCLIALWKCQKGAGFRLVKVAAASRENESHVAVWNKFFRIFGYELQATRLRAAAAAVSMSKERGDNGNLAVLTEEMDQLATKTLGKYFLCPLILGFVLHTLINEEHPGWYTWFITSASSAVYGLGFVLMTPQLFLNYKLKSVAHLPWRVLGYRFVNTFIDDLFAFIIRMPTMARISCFRDDVVFMIYLWQRYLYPVDTSRPVEGGGMDAVSAAASTAKVQSSSLERDDKKKKE
jgi:hypothetical protein